MYSYVFRDDAEGEGEDIYKEFIKACKKNDDKSLEDVLKSSSVNQLIILLSTEWEGFTHNLTGQQQQIVKLVIEHCKFRIQEGNNPKLLKLTFIHACVLGDMGIAKDIYNLAKVVKLKEQLLLPDDDGDSALAYACASGHANLVEFIIKELKTFGQLEDVCLQSNKQDMTCLHLACYYGYDKIVGVLLQGLDDPIKQKLCIKEAGSNSRYSALHMASKAGYSDCVNALLKNVDNETKKDLLFGRDSLKYTAFQLACMEDHSGCVTAQLKNRGPLVSDAELVLCTDESGRTGFHWACLRGSVDCVTEHLVQLSEPLKERVVLTAGFFDGNTAFYLACEKGYANCAIAHLDHLHVNVVAKVLKKKNRDGSFPLHAACSNTKNVEQMAEMLTEIPKEVKERVMIIKDDKAETVLHRACKQGCKEYVAALLENISDSVRHKVSTALSNNQRSPLSFAFQNNHIDCAEILLDDMERHTVYELVSCDKTVKECFPEFCVSVKYKKTRTKEKEAESQTEARSVSYLFKNHPLVLTGERGCISLIKHPYIQAYIDLCWQSFRYLFYVNAAVYMIFLLLLILFVTSQVTINESKQANQITNSTFQATQVPDLLLSQPLIESSTF